MLDGVNSKEICPSISYGEEGKAFNFRDKERLLEAFRPNRKGKKLRSHPSKRFLNLTRIKP